jgi:lipopolysaccharide assembly outer membrane protein LptD (OstA)
MVATTRRRPPASRGAASALFTALLALGGPAIAAPADLHPSELDLPDDAEIAIEADEVSHDDVAHTMRASGHLVVTYGAATATADALVFDTEARRGTLSGHVTLTGPTFDLTADAARFDLKARHAELDHFGGRWAERAQIGGDRLIVEEKVITLEKGFITPCQAPEPDLKLRADVLRYFPGAEFLNLAAEGVAIEVLGRTVLALPTFSSTVGRE